MKARSKKKQEQRRKELLKKEAEERKLAKEREFLRGPLFSRKLRDKEGPRKPVKHFVEPIMANDGRNDHLSIVSVTEKLATTNKTQVKYKGDMERREREAQKEIERKKKRIAPAYNKGAYQYITDETNPTDLGK